MTQDLLTVKEAAEILMKMGVRAKQKTVYGWIEKGLLRARKLPTGTIYVTQEAIDEFVGQEREGGEPCQDVDATTENTSKSS